MGHRPRLMACLLPSGIDLTFKRDIFYPELFRFNHTGLSANLASFRPGFSEEPPI
jgi:hypothetical protein